METGICSECNIEKPLEDFPKAKKYKTGRRNYCKQCKAAYARKWYKKNPHRVKRPSKKRVSYRLHKLSDEKYQTLLEMYNKKCHLCLINPATKVDHDHRCCDKNKSCGKCVRGILCSRCNTMLGMLEVNFDVYEKIPQYINIRYG